MKVRRYLRGRGRVLAFVFVASVVWLLFDMAALRLSINDVNGRILKEKVIRERQILKQQALAAQLTKGGFKHPLQKVNLGVLSAGKDLNSGVKLAEVYRQRVKKQEQKVEDKERKSVENRGHTFVLTQQPKFLLPQHKEGTILQVITPERDVTMKNKVDNFLVSEIKIEKRLETDASRKQKLPLVSVGTVQENKEPSLSLSEKESPKGENVVQSPPDKTAARRTEGVKDRPKNGTTDGRLGPLETHPAQTASRPPNKDRDMKKANTKTGEKRVKTAASSDLTPAEHISKRAAGTDPGSKPDSAAVRKAGVHRVQHLDATLVPRDARAVGQFGRAALVSSSEDAQVKKRWDEGFFNVYLSDQIPVDRALPDTRPET